MKIYKLPKKKNDVTKNHKRRVKTHWSLS